MIERRSRGLLLIVAAAAFLGACERGDMRDLQDYVEQVKQRKPGRIEPLPEIKPVETFVYLAQGRRDPFAASDESTTETLPVATSGISPDPNRRKEELESFPLDSIRMVGTMDRNDQMWGLVVTQDGIIYRVKQGNYLGQNHGKISRVSEDKIDLTEIVPDGSGSYVEKQSSVALSE